MTAYLDSKFDQSEADRPDSAYLVDIWAYLEQRPDSRCVIVGFGSLGSAVGLALSAWRIPYLAVDPDVWSARNRFNALHVPPENEEGGVPKADLCMSVQQALEENKLPVDPWLAITATDNLESRRFCYRNLLPRVGFVDLRTGKDTATIVSSSQGTFMDAMLPPDGVEVEELGCAERGTMAHTMAIGGLGAARALSLIQRRLAEENIPDSFDQFGLFQQPFWALAPVSEPEAPAPV